MEFAIWIKKEEKTLAIKANGQAVYKFSNYEDCKAKYLKMYAAGYAADYLIGTIADYNHYNK